jgi:hypothetical protein
MVMDHNEGARKTEWTDKVDHIRASSPPSYGSLAPSMGSAVAEVEAAVGCMPETQSPRPKSIRVKIAGKTYVATYDVQDDCVQVTHKGRRSVWTELRGLRAEDVARAMLKELLGVLLAAVCLGALLDQRLGAKSAHPGADTPHYVATGPAGSA